MYENLKKIRKEAGASIEVMANVIEKTPCNYSKKENGSVKFSLNEAIKIATFFNRKVEEVFLPSDFQ